MEKKERNRRDWFGIRREDGFQERKGEEKSKIGNGIRKGKFENWGLLTVESMLELFRFGSVIRKFAPRSGYFPRAGQSHHPLPPCLGKESSLVVDVVATPSAFVVSRRTRGNSISRGGKPATGKIRKILLEFNPDAVFPSLASSLPFQ